MSAEQPTVPYGYCHCGCGGKTTIARCNSASSGRIKGEPVRFIRYHHRRIPLRWLSEDRGYETPCHIWQLHLGGAGYGSTWHESQADRPIGAHCAAWIDANGPIPDGLSVLHKCDVRACVNPDHLFLGTQSDNVRDMYAKGRGQTKLSPEQVVAIRSAVATGRGQRAVAATFGVTQSMVSKIVRRDVWKHVP